MRCERREVARVAHEDVEPAEAPHARGQRGLDGRARRGRRRRGRGRRRPGTPLRRPARCRARRPPRPACGRPRRRRGRCRWRRPSRARCGRRSGGGAGALRGASAARAPSTRPRRAPPRRAGASRRAPRPTGSSARCGGRCRRPDRRPSRTSRSSRARGPARRPSAAPGREASARAVVVSAEVGAVRPRRSARGRRRASSPTTAGARLVRITWSGVTGPRAARSATSARLAKPTASSPPSCRATSARARGARRLAPESRRARAGRATWGALARAGASQAPAVPERVLREADQPDHPLVALARVVGEGEDAVVEEHHAVERP